jgi:hypothetical protein
MIRPIPFEPRRAPAPDLPVAIVGGGPVGLAAAAHLLARGIEPVVFEQGDTVGAAVRDWGHVAMFSPWSFNIDAAAAAILERNGWTRPDAAAFPTGHDIAVRYLEPLAATPEIAGRLRLGCRVTGIARTGVGKMKTAGRDARSFEIRFADARGGEGRLLARAVIDASGTWLTPVPAGASGLPALGERAAADRIRYGMPDVLGAERQRYAGKRVLVVGGGHSATGTLIDLAALAADAPATRIVWALRKKDVSSVFGGGDADQLARRGALGQALRRLTERGAYEIVAPFLIDTIARAADDSLRVSGEGEAGAVAIDADEMIVATGLRPDLSFLGELRLDLDPALDCPRTLAPLIDPNVHSCGTVRPHGWAELALPEANLFIVGMKAYGRAPTFLLATGYEQIRSIAAHLAGDAAAARRVELALPETGVCSGPGPAVEQTDAAAAGCCGGPAPAGIDACCVADAEAKADGEAGCGCGPAAEPEARPAAKTGCCGAAV